MFSRLSHTRQGARKTTSDYRSGSRSVKTNVFNPTQPETAPGTSTMPEEGSSKSRPRNREAQGRPTALQEGQERPRARNLTRLGLGWGLEAGGRRGFFWREVRRLGGLGSFWVRKGSREKILTLRRVKGLGWEAQIPCGVKPDIFKRAAPKWPTTFKIR